MKFLKLQLVMICFFYVSSNLYANCKVSNKHSKVVVAGGSLTEIIYLLNLENNLVGVDVTSKFPESVKELPSIGYVRRLASEGVLSLKPELIIAEEDVGPPAVVNQIGKTSIDLRIIEDKHTFGGIKEKIQCISNIFGLENEKNQVVYNAISKKIQLLQDFKAINKKKSKKFLIILMMRGTSPVVAGTNTSGDGFLKSLGLQNSMSEVDGWKPVSKEEIILADPEYIIVTDRAFKSFSSKEQFFLKTGTNLTRAGKENNLIVKDGMALLGFGPRTLDAAISISKFLKE